MVIENKRTRNRESVTPEQWDKIKDIGFANNWRVVSTDVEPLSPKVLKPMEVINFKTLNKKKNGRNVRKTNLPDNKAV